MNLKAARFPKGDLMSGRYVTSPRTLDGANVVMSTGLVFPQESRLGR